MAKKNIQMCAILLRLPRALRTAYKAALSRRDISMTEDLINYIKDVVDEEQEYLMRIHEPEKK